MLNYVNYYILIYYDIRKEGVSVPRVDDKYFPTSVNVIDIVGEMDRSETCFVVP